MRLITIIAIVAITYAASSSFGQSHMPTSSLGQESSALRIRTVLTVDAKYAELAPDVGTPDPVELISGSLLSSASPVIKTKSSTPGSLPIKWRLETGTYFLTMLGFTDDKDSPERNMVLETILVTETREDRVRNATLDQEIIDEEVDGLAPTMGELIDISATE